MDAIEPRGEILTVDVNIYPVYARIHLDWAAILTVPETVAPLAGEVIFTVGAAVEVAVGVAGAIR